MRAGVEFRNLNICGSLLGGELPAVNPVDHQMQRAEHGEGDDENDPAFELVKEAACELDIVFAQNSGDGNASGVSDDGDGNHSDEQSPAHPQFLIEEIRVNEREERE